VPERFYRGSLGRSQASAKGGVRLDRKWQVIPSLAFPRRCVASLGDEGEWEGKFPATLLALGVFAGQRDGGDGHGGDAFTAADGAQQFHGGGFDANIGGGDAQRIGK
jgi:hypothetical protein